MDLTKILVELRRELDYLDAAILSLERLGETTARRGRASKMLSELRRPNQSRERPTAGGRRAHQGGETQS
jgi:hypothetical protein